MAQEAKTSTTFSHDEIISIRSEAFAAVRIHAATLQTLANGIEALDTSLQQSIAVRGIDQQSELIVSARRLKSLLDGSGGENV